MREYLENFDHLRLWLWAWATALLTPFWVWVQAHWGGFWVSNPLVWLAIFWAADFCLGFGRAASDGWRHPEDKTRGVDKRKILQSLLKLIGYVAGLMVAWGLRDAVGIGGGAVASVAEVGILCYEAASVFGHLGAITGVPVFNFIAQSARIRAGGKKESSAQVPE